MFAALGLYLPRIRHIYIYIVFCVLLVLCFIFSSSHGTDPWEGAFNQLGNKLTFDGVLEQAVY